MTLTVTHRVNAHRQASPSSAEPAHHLAPASLLRGAKWAWSARGLSAETQYSVLSPSRRTPRPGDVALVRVERVGHHTRVMTAHEGRLRLYPGDRLIGVFGNRYATDGFEANVLGTDELSMLTDAGMIGTVLSRHSSMKSPTRLSLAGFVADQDGAPLNLRQKLFTPRRTRGLPPKTVLVVGSGMNSGKTTAAAKLTRALVEREVRVAACKLTGSVSYRDLSELRSTGADDVRDFSCYGFPSTYLADQTQLLDLFHTMLADAHECQPDVVVMEVADGVLQRETELLLTHPHVRESLHGVLLAATCSGSALFAIDRLARQGHRILGVSGVVTSSPLFVRELDGHADVLVASSAGHGDDLAHVVMRADLSPPRATTGPVAVRFDGVAPDAATKPIAAFATHPAASSAARAA